jgi:hypothetical protein
MDEMRKNAAWAAKRLAEIQDDLEEIVLVAEGPSSKHDPEAMVHVYGSVQKAVTDIRIRVSKDLEDARKVFYNVSRGKRASGADEMADDLKKALKAVQRGKWLHAEKLLKDLQRTWRKDRDINALIAAFLHHAEEQAYSDDGKHEKLALKILKRMEAAFDAGYPSQAGQKVLRGKKATKTSLRTSLIKAAYEMKPGEDRSELLALLLADFDPKEIGQTVPSPPGTHGGFTQKKFREQKELRDQGKLTFRRASDKPKKTDALKAMQGKKQTKELAEKAEQSGMSKRTFYDLIADALVFNSPWISDLAKYLNTKLKQKGAGSEFLEAVENSQYVRKELKQIHEDTWK